MKKWQTRALAAVAVVFTAAAATTAVVTRQKAHELITNPAQTRRVPHKTPADYQLPFEDLTIRSADGLKLAGWFIPSQNGAVIIFVHGYKDQRGSMLGAAAMYVRHGYGVLLASVRAHDRSEGEQLSFGHEEMKDLEAWYRFTASHDGVDAGRIAMLGVSMGGSLAIQYASQNARVAAVIADCAFSSLDDTVETSVKFFTGLPPFPFAPMIRFWAEREGGFSFADIDAKKWIRTISPRPVFLMQGGADVVVSPASGQALYEAAGQPKELWYEPTLGHARFFDERQQEYERRVVAWVERYLGR